MKVLQGDTVKDIEGLRDLAWTWTQIAAHYRVSEREVRRWVNDPAAAPSGLSAPLALNWGTALIVSDTQFPYVDEPGWEVTCEIARDAGVDRILWNGDMLDFDQLSSYAHNPYKIRQSEEDVAEFSGRIRQPLIDALVRPAEEDWNDGNHEFRLERYWERNAGAIGRPPDPKEFLRLPDHVRYERYGKLCGTWLTPKLLVAHGWNARKHSAYTAKANAEEIGSGSVITGHTHRTGWFSHTTADGTQGAWEIGHMCDPSNLPKAVEGHQNWQHVVATLVRFERGGDAFSVEIVPTFGPNSDRAVCHTTDREYRVDRRRFG